MFKYEHLLPINISIHTYILSEKSECRGYVRRERKGEREGMREREREGGERETGREKGRQ